jgi:serine/threonine protein phosphatase PrpC
MNNSVQQEEMFDMLIQCVQKANQAIYQQNAARNVPFHEAKAMMGTTITVAVSLGTRLYVANIGDSRAYIQRRGEPLHQITHDHSLVADWLTRGEISAEEVYTHPQRNIIYRSLGAQKEVEVDTFCEQMKDGDMILLCSDGLWEMLPESRLIEDVLASPGLGVEQMAEHLVHLARCGGGRDNIGLIVVHVRIPDMQDLPTLLIPPQRSVPTLASTTSATGVSQ